MLSQRFKDMYFNLFSYPLSKIKLPWLRFYYKNRYNLKLNLGSGQNYLKNFLNIDGSIVAKEDLFLDIRVGLPFKDSSVAFVYASNFLEHFYPDELIRILREIYRVLSSRGVLRICVPDLEASAHSYINQDYIFFSNFSRNFSSIGGRFSNFIFYDGQHKIGFDLSFASEILLKVGFKDKNIKKVYPGQTAYLALTMLDSLRPQEESFIQGYLFLEALK